MNIIILGAGGHIGSAVYERLSRGRNSVMALTKELYNVVTGDENNSPMIAVGSTDAVVCCVGHCPAGGFLDAIKSPLSNFPQFKFDEEIDMHVRGPLYIFQDFILTLRKNGCFIFMSSAATRILQMPRNQRPPINLYHHLAVIAAEDALIEGMRMDPLVKAHEIKIHRIVPPAIGDSPFHKVEGGPKLPVTVRTDEVVDAIESCLTANEHTDVIMVSAASPSSKSARCGGAR